MDDKDTITERKSPKDEERERITSDIKNAHISLMKLQAAKLGVEQGLMHLQIELESL